MRIVGVDENGLGPRLGPLIATALTVEVRRYDADRLHELGTKLKVGDSKQTSAFGKMAHAEGLALALAERTLGRLPRYADELIEALSIDGLLTLRGPCPDPTTAQQCWMDPLPLPAFGGEADSGHEILAALQKGGVKIQRLRTGIVCASLLNTALAGGQTKLQVDLELFERLLLDARAAGKDDVLGICGMVGGIRRYGKYFQRFRHAKAVTEEKGRSTYHVPKLGEVTFEVKADDRHLPVGLASMVGKYVRELGMARIVLFYQGHLPDLPAASGYHDSVTNRFVDATAPVRTRLPIAPECFERRG
ncbi:MAG: hypothetical protein AAGE52_36560 [Myxococcota bacterium]